MPSSPPHSILTSGTSKKEEHVKFDASVQDVEKKSGPPSTPPPGHYFISMIPNRYCPISDPSKVTAPVVKCPIKDEVELLREGKKNIHGEHIKHPEEK